MNFPAHIFKAYDIRGLSPGEITADIAFRIGRAFAAFVKRELSVGPLTVAVGGDMRLTTPILKQAVIKGIIAQGINVVDIGLVSTPTFYFGVSYYRYNAGIQVSASHNPGKYNGFKMVRARAVPISGDSGIYDIRDAAEKNDPTTHRQMLPRPQPFFLL